MLATTATANSRVVDVGQLFGDPVMLQRGPLIQFAHVDLCAVVMNAGAQWVPKAPAQGNTDK